MKILLLRNYNPFNESSASGNRFIGLIEGLCKESFHVTIGITGGLVRSNEHKNTVNVDNCSVVYLSKANHYQGLIGRLNTYFFDRFHLSLVGLRLKRLMKQQYDIVWLTNNSNVLKLYRKGLNGFSGKTFIELNEYNDIYKEEKQGNFLQRIKGKNGNMVFMDAVGKIDLFAVMTKTLIKYYQGMAKKDARFMHLPMTVDLSRFTDIPVEDSLYQKPYIAFTGTMDNHKDGVDILIKAFAKIADKYKLLHLYLAGFWHYDVPVQDELIAGIGLKDRIHRLGVLNREQIPAFIGNASLLVLSRPDSHQAQGGFPTKLGEYLATGNPVCVTKVGEIPDYLEDNVSAFMAEPGDVNSFADAMDRALCDLDNAKQVGIKGRKMAEEHFSAEVQAKRLAEFLKKNIQ